MVVCIAVQAEVTVCFSAGTDRHVLRVEGKLHSELGCLCPLGSLQAVDRWGERLVLLCAGAQVLLSDNTPVTHMQKARVLETLDMPHRLRWRWPWS